MQADPKGAVIVRIIEPAPFVKYPTAAHGGDDRNKPVDDSKSFKAVPAPFVAEIRLRGGL